MKLRGRFVALLGALTFILASCQWASEPDFNAVGELEVYIFGIGRSDAILITTENHVVMIDTGERQHGSIIVEYLLGQEIDTIDYLVITHFDNDHVGGAYVILDGINVRNVIVPNYSRESNHVRRFEAALERAQLEPIVPSETMRFTLDHAEFMVNPSDLGYTHFARHDEDDADEIIAHVSGNDFSIVVSLRHGGNNFLFTGDVVAGRIQELLENDEIMNTNYDFLKVPRHGRHNRRIVEFIEQISPNYAVITGFHPDLISYYYPQRPTDRRVIAALEDVRAEMFFTMSVGVRVRSDGRSLSVEYEK